MHVLWRFDSCWESPCELFLEINCRSVCHVTSWRRWRQWSHSCVILNRQLTVFWPSTKLHYRQQRPGVQGSDWNHSRREFWRTHFRLSWLVNHVISFVIWLVNNVTSFVEMMSDVAFFLAGRSADALKQRSLYQCALKVNIYCEVGWTGACWSTNALQQRCLDQCALNKNWRKHLLLLMKNTKYLSWLVWLILYSREVGTSLLWRNLKNPSLASVEKH